MAARRSPTRADVKVTPDTYGRVTVTDPVNTAVSGLQDPVNIAVPVLQPEPTKRACAPELQPPTART